MSQKVVKSKASAVVASVAKVPRQVRVDKEMVRRRPGEKNRT